MESQNSLPSAGADDTITCFKALMIFSNFKVSSDCAILGSPVSAFNVTTRCQQALDLVNYLLTPKEALCPDTCTDIIWSFNSLLHLINEKDWRADVFDDDDDTDGNDNDDVPAETLLFWGRGWRLMDDNDDVSAGDDNDVPEGDSDGEKDRLTHAVKCLLYFILAAQGYQGTVTDDMVDLTIITRFRVLLHLDGGTDETMAEAVTYLNDFLSLIAKKSQSSSL
ncbi:hypothetical protein Q9L58_008683 [Maublancomyces gigas]|uniref:Uncharacterized protein n=1 Tax=Discina gigas TaxID=1032678 RepID=A0ABR3G904_9PEZI